MSQLDAILVTDTSQIEKAVEAFLLDRVDEVDASARQRDSRFLFGNCLLTVAIIRVRDKLQGTKFQTAVIINVMLTFSDAGGEQDRRDGISPLVQGIRKALSRQRLGLAITDILPRGWQEVTTEELWEKNQMAINIEFETSFDWAPDKTEQDPSAPDLIGVGIEYFLKPGDDKADAGDDITINEEP